MNEPTLVAIYCLITVSLMLMLAWVAGYKEGKKDQKKNDQFVIDSLHERIINLVDDKMALKVEISRLSLRREN